MKHKILLLYSWLIRTLFYFFPDMPVIMRFRGYLYGLGMEKCGRDFQVTHDAIIRDLQRISIGKKCFVGNGVVIMGSGKILIRDEVMFAPHTVIISGNHTSVNGSFRYGASEAGVIYVGCGAWVAANCTISKGASLPDNSVLAANSFLNKEYTEVDSIYGGVPARFIKKNHA